MKERATSKGSMEESKEEQYSMDKQPEYNIKDELDELSIECLKAVLNGEWTDKNEGKSNGGEVFTPHWCVVDMCNMVDDKLGDPNNLVLEPACGSGNIVIEIARRKIVANVRKVYQTPFHNVVLHSIIDALSTVYGVDIAKDNVLATRKRLKVLVSTFWQLLYKQDIPWDRLAKEIEDVLERNIIWGNTLENVMWSTDEADGNQVDKPMRFFNWKTRQYEFFADSDTASKLAFEASVAGDCDDDKEVDDF